jgi:CheY-like chemotaxis protein
MIDPVTMTVLIIDDMPNMCKSIRGMLKVLRYGKNFHFGNNGLEGWNILKENPVDLMIVDWNMPIMSGVELLGRIREDRALRDLPVIMVTAEANRDIVAEAAESEIDAYILKPLTVKSLGDKIVKVIDKANDPPPMVTHLKKARDLEEEGNFEAAIEEAKLAMIADPMSSRPIREIGYYYFKNNQLEIAEKYLLDAANMNELDVFAFHYLGELYLQLNNIDMAAKYFDKAMTISPRHVSRGTYFGKVLVEKKMISKAKKVFNKVIELSDNPEVIREEIAWYCMEKEVYEYAIELMDHLVKKDSERHDLLFQMGLAYEKIGQYNRALGYFTDADNLDENNVETMMHIARNYIAIDKALRADHYLQAIMRIDPKNQEALELLRKNI